MVSSPVVTALHVCMLVSKELLRVSGGIYTKVCTGEKFSIV